MALTLYPAQQEYIEAIRQSFKKGNRKIVLCAPTGFGKSLTFTFMSSEHIKRGGKVLILTHRSELLKQASNTFSNFGLEPDFIKSGHTTNPEASLHVAMVETLNSNFDKFVELVKSKTLVVIDEAHLNTFNKILPLISETAYVIGATATPYRSPKEIQMGDFYQDLIQLYDTQDVLNFGNLMPAKSYGVLIDLSKAKKSATDYDTKSYYEENRTYEGVVSNWKKLAMFSKTILFASNVESSKRVCHEFQDWNFRAKHIDGTMSEKERTEIFEWYDKTPDAILCNCGIATTGFDQPDITTVILYRATTSLPLFLQMCGRGSRKHPNKDHFKILDFGNNIERFGYWEDRRTWKLFYEKKSDKEKAHPMKTCPNCTALLHLSKRKCEYCDFEFPKTEKEIIEEIELVELTKMHGRKLSQLSVNEIILLQKRGKLSAPMAWRVVRAMGWDFVRYYADCMNYSNSWLFRQKDSMDDVKFKDYEILAD